METAVASINPVATHSIWFLLTPKALIICGRATLTMLVSRMAMKVPVMMRAKTAQR
jgi:hypothetical protein